jgi:NTE family protein
MRHRFGLVLSGGGSRGLAHAGVLRALVEAGLDPDCISGTSSGALIGALHASGRDTGEILDFFEKTSPIRLSRLAGFGKAGWLDTDKIEDDIRSWFPDDSFEALDRPLFVSATDLERGRLQVFHSGPLVRPLLASSSIPFVFTPTTIGGRTFADGGILDNFPVDPLREICDVVVGVHATPLAEKDAGALDSSLSVTRRALEVAMHHGASRKFERADLVLSAAGLGDYATFDIRRHREIVEIGARVAREHLAEIRALLEAADTGDTASAPA